MASHDTTPPLQAAEVIQGQNSAIGSALTPPWASAAASRNVRNLLASGTPPLSPPSVAELQQMGWASPAQQRLAAVAQQSGGTIPYDTQSLVNINAGQNALITQVGRTCPPRRLADCVDCFGRHRFNFMPHVGRKC